MRRRTSAASREGGGFFVRVVPPVLFFDEDHAPVAGLARNPKIVVTRFLETLEANVGGDGVVAVRHVRPHHRNARGECEEEEGETHEEEETHLAHGGATTRVHGGLLLKR